MRRALPAFAAFALSAACSSREAAAPVADAGPGPAVARPAPPPVPVPDTVQLLRDGSAALQRGDPDAAVLLLTVLVEKQPNNAAAYNLLGRAHAQAALDGGVGRSALAKAAFEKAASADPKFWPALQNLGDLLETEGDLRGAASAYARLLAVHPTHVERERFVAAIERADAGAPAPKGK